MKLIALVAVMFVLALPAGAQEFMDSVFRGEVVEITSTGVRSVPATGITTEFQDLRVQLEDGRVIEVENTTSSVLREGDRLYMHLSLAEDGTELWAVGEPDRVPVLLWLAALFALVTVVAGGMAGVRSLFALVGSFLILIFGLVPALSLGAPPVVTSVGFAVVMLVFSMIVTHGVNRLTLVALAGSVLALAVSAVVAESAVVMARLSGFVSDEVVYLNFATKGALDLSALLLGSILIGVVGVLNDISVSQVHTASEIHSANPSLSRRELLVRAMRVGREHLGAVVNTLPLAYAGASLPLLMIFAASQAPLDYIINREVFSAEIIRILAGGIALSLSGAVATILAVFTLVRHKKLT